MPPIEPGDFIDIQGETSDREVAVIESSNSLITFDYLGSVFGQNATATAVLTSGFIDKVQVTNGGSGYSNPGINVETTVPDDWTAPDISTYGEELVDPETP